MICYYFNHSFFFPPKMSQSNKIPILDEDEEKQDKLGAYHIDILTQAWINEKFAPDILPYKKESVDFLIEKLKKRQEELLEDLEDSSQALIRNLMQMEYERIRFIVTSYLRTRIQKIEKYPQYFLNHLKNRLSKQEIEFAER